MDKCDEYKRLAGVFLEKEGKYPSRLDWRGENLVYFRNKHGIEYPSERQVQRAFGNWGTLLVELGEAPKRTQETADVAVEYVRERYAGVEVMPGRSGTIDCFIGNERVEIKGATIRKDEVIRTPRWRFRLHGREYSRLVDKLILVGLVGEKPVVEWSLDKVGMFLETDKRDTLSIPAKYPFNNLSYNMFMYETWRLDVNYEELLEIAREEGNV